MSHKRKYRKVAPSAIPVATPDPFTLSIQAYEATIIRGPQSLSTALSLEAPHLPTLGVYANDPQIGNALIQWGASARNFQLLNSDFSFPEASDGKATWVDRYDARLLLDTVREHPILSTIQPKSLSPTGWSDLPSDTEDTFFLTPHENEDYRREKRRRLIDQNREDRLRALAETDESEQLDLWGGSDEEPDDAQSELMKRTALHLLSSPNPAQLEMRILANHGADKRFAFLRGRWSRAWRMTKERLRQEKVDQSAQSLRASRNILVGLGGLAAYGDSDDEGGEEESESGETYSLKVGESPATALDSPQNHNVRLEEVEQEARRVRAREWAAQRRAQQGQTLSTDEYQADSSDS
ncbi:uncharacterized protein EDB93DRAFT_1153525 [Suillus bovinus]|uniref:uncharacterized protein n=1 Tax=Suillus bovinus TaxID=48563 RepID=UPI001B870352|nr:uncharacterized protein EDB93DRAFT_1153525 [Suillus bovinus]KAG2144449.1 hypothetical protein EDB93DRAFT_1153525 [Suillus bovinus]